MSKYTINPDEPGESPAEALEWLLNRAQAREAARFKAGDRVVSVTSDGALVPTNTGTVTADCPVGQYDVELDWDDAEDPGVTWEDEFPAHLLRLAE